MIEALGKIVGATNVWTGDDAAPLLVDHRGVYRAEAVPIVRPGSVDELAQVMAWAEAGDAVVVTQGGNTGMSGGQIPRAPSPSDERNTIVLSVARLNRIEQVNPEGWTMTVQAGVTIQAMHDAAAQAGRQFAPDWGARGSATIGGAIATDAGGNNVLRYGNLRDQVLGVEAVLADGRTWNGLRALRKDSSGYDLKQLLIGSEGTLGVVTRAVVKLVPATPETSTAMASLTSLDSLMALLELARRRCGDDLVAFELMPEVGVDRVCTVYDLAHPLAERADFYGLIKLASAEPVADRLTGLLDTAAQAGLITDAAVAASADQQERLWMIRDELSPHRLWPLITHALKGDTAVPIDLLAEYHRGVSAIAAEVTPTALTYGFGHVGDGNLHLYVVPLDEAGLDEFLAAKPELSARIDELLFSLGGTVSAEHGIGRELRDRVGAQKPAIEWELMRGIKSLFDPTDRLNPGVLLPPVA